MRMTVNKRANIWITAIIFILFIITATVIVFYVSSVYETKPGELSPCEQRCQKECQKFDYTFYKIDNCYIRWENCWCLDENKKPKALGELP